MKNGTRKSKIENRGSGPAARARTKEKLCAFELWFSNWVVHRD